MPFRNLLKLPRLAPYPAGLVAIVVAFAATSMVLIGGLVVQEAAEKALEVRQDLRQHTEVVAAALAQPLWTLNQDQASRVLSGLSASPRFVAAWVDDDRGVRFAEAGARPTDAAETLTETVDVFAPFEARDRRVGAVTVAYGVRAIAEARDHVFMRFGVAAATLLAVVLVATTLLFRRFVRPLTAVTDGLQRIAEGELTTSPPHLDRPDEIGVLARAVETLREQAVIASQATEELRVARDDLARQVEARTAALAASEQRFADFAHAGGDWLWEMDANLRFTYFSENVKRIVGVDPEWHYGKSRRDLLGPDYDRAAWDEHLRTLDEHKPFRDFLYRRIGEGIEPRWLRTSGVPVFDADGTFRGYRGTASDVTREVEAIAALKAVMDAVPTFISVEDADGRYVMLNRFAADFMQVAAEQAIGRTAFELMPEMPAAAVTARSRSVVQTGTSTGFFQLRLAGADAVERDWLAVKVPHMDGDGRVRWVITVATDITEQKRIEARLAAIAERLRRQNEALDELTRHEALGAGDAMALFRSTTEVLSRVLNVQRVSAWRFEKNAAALTCVDVFTLDQAHASQARPLSVDDPQYLEAFRLGREIDAGDARDHAPMLAMRKSDPASREVGAALAVPIRLGGATMGAVYCEHFGGPRHWDDDERAFGIAAADLLALALQTEEKRAAETRLRQAHKMEALGQLTGGIAHDFNNLLAVIMGNLELLIEQRADDSRQADRISRVIKAAERGAGLVRQLLAFSRRQALDPRPVDVVEMIERMRDLLSRSLGEPIEIRTKIAPDVWACRADPGQLEAALLNLAVNARDAMPNGGVLTIEAANLGQYDNEAIRGPDTAARDFVRLSMIDTGAGMPPEVLARAFEPFFTTKEVGRGTGLGLSMVDGFVHQSGGYVRIQSEAGHGTAVHLYLPRDQSAELPASDATPITTPPDLKLRILVVEDSPPMREIACSMLSSLGHHVVAAANGREALAALDQEPDVDLVFTDVVMPGGMDGVELVGAVRRRRPGIKAILMSGYNEVMLSGTTEVSLPLIRKPFRIGELSAMLSRTFAGEVRERTKT